MVWLFLTYMLIMYAASLNGLRFGNSIPPYVFFPLALMVFRFAYFKPEVSQKLLRGNDISYGIYIWHMPLVNQLLYLKQTPNMLDVSAVILGSIVIAWLSWIIVERNAMRLKNFSVKPPPKYD